MSGARNRVGGRLRQADPDGGAPSQSRPSSPSAAFPICPAVIPFVGRPPDLSGAGCASPAKLQGVPSCPVYKTAEGAIQNCTQSAGIFRRGLPPACLDNRLFHHAPWSVLKDKGQLSEKESDAHKSEVLAAPTGCSFKLPTAEVSNSGIQSTAGGPLNDVEQQRKKFHLRVILSIGAGRQSPFGPWWRLRFSGKRHIRPHRKRPRGRQTMTV